MHSTAPEAHLTSHIPPTTDRIITPYTLSLTLRFLPGGGSTSLDVLEVTEETSEPIRSVAGMVFFFMESPSFFVIGPLRELLLYQSLR